jgi:hypothetical protein
LPVGETDNAETSRGQADSRPNQKALLVRPAVQKGSRHSLNAPVGDRPLSHQIDHACDAAHSYSSSSKLLDRLMISPTF